VSKKWGGVLFAYIIVAILLPRIYVGIHYPTDILGGAALAFVAVVFLADPKLAAFWTRPVFLLLDRHPVIFYVIFFLLLFEMATLFWDIRTILNQMGFSS
jgi:undecaprenyl-diphosphatase